MHKLTAALIPALLALPALAQEAVMTDANSLTTAPTEWLGEVPHFVMMGTVNGRALDIQMTDIAAASGVEEFAGKREYLPGGAGAYRYGDFEVALKAAIGGVERSIELEFENDDFRSHTLPATFALQAENFPKGPLAFVEIQLEWEDASGSVNDELGASTGTLMVALDTGTADDKGLIADGLIGGYAVAELGSDKVVISFTVPVAEYEIDD